ncbi:MAG: NAD(P)-binding protein [Actinobacteria bacterium]|nr:NAD(P)-binding protein [Actinomycetota bacterium]
MSTAERHLSLFEPIRLGPKTLPNRFYQVPHCGTGDLRPGMQTAFRAMRAEGGWGAVCVESASIAPETDHWPVHLARIWDENDVRSLAGTCEAIHQHGSLAGIELWWGGSNSPGLETRTPPRAPSQIAVNGTPWVIPQEIRLADIAEIQAHFVAAADRARRAGFDLIYVYGAHSQGPMQFLSETFNRRTDAYGGSFENRARFWLECLEKVREGVGEKIAVTTRMSVEDFGWGGVSIDEACRFIELADDLVDYWDVNVGSLDWSTDIASSRFFPENSQQPWTSRVRDHTSKPIVCVGRFTNPDTMAAALSSGQCDIIGAARPAISDPFLPNKIRDGRLGDIRECIGCNFCLSRWAQGGAPVACTQNATAGEEYRRGWHPERFSVAANADRTVLVVGAGPAGMECARVLGKRGMDAVHLVDAAPEIGGALEWISTLPRMREWHRVIDYRRIQLDVLRNVTVVNGSRLDLEGVLDYGADIVVLATGSSWVGDGLSAATMAPIPGADASLPHVVTPEQLVLEGKEVGEKTLIYDCDGNFMGVALAERLARVGKAVTLATPAETPAEYSKFTGEVPQVRRTLEECGVTVRVESVVREIGPGAVALGGVYSEASREEEFDSVVLVTQRTSNDGLYRELDDDEERSREAGIEAIYRIGDCVAPRLIGDVVFDGHRLGREIDSASPAVHLPFIREVRVVGGYQDSDYDRQIMAEDADPAPVPQRGNR